MTQATREQLLELYKDLRVADVRDGMEWNMMPGSPPCKR